MQNSPSLRRRDGLCKFYLGLFNRKSLSPDCDADDLIKIDRSAAKKARILDYTAFRLATAQGQPHLPTGTVRKIHRRRTLYFFDGSKP